MEIVYTHAIVLTPWSSNHTRITGFPCITYEGSEIESQCLCECTCEAYFI